MNSRRLYPMVTAFVLFALTIYFMGPLTRFLVDAFWLRPGVTETVGLLPWAQADKSSIVQQKALASPDIVPVFGSSELRSGHDFAPGAVFMDKPTGFATFYMGGAWYQCLPHLIELAGQSNLYGEKMVILLPTDWFLNGLTPRNFARNFSPLNVYRMLFAPGLPAPLRQAIITRILQFPQVVDKYRILNLFLRSYLNRNHGWSNEMVHLALWPVARFDFASLEFQDFLLTIKDLKKINPKIVAGNSRNGSAVHQINWGALRARAIQQGKAAITNGYGVDDSFLPRLITPRARGSQRNVRLGRSPEYGDLALLLKVLRAKRAKPLFIILPFNGPYRDFTGLPVAQREQHYQRLRRMLSAYGYPFVDLSSQEYQPYYFNDAIHLSGRAWVDLDEIINDYYHNTLRLVHHVPVFITPAPRPTALTAPGAPMPPDPHDKPRPLSPPWPSGWPANGPYNLLSLWVAGDRPDYPRHVWDTAYAFSGNVKTDPRQGFIGTSVPGGPAPDDWSGIWKTPGPWGAVKITGISGNVVDFTTHLGITGVFNLDNHAWKEISVPANQTNLGDSQHQSDLKGGINDK